MYLSLFSNNQETNAKLFQFLEDNYNPLYLLTFLAFY